MTERFDLNPQDLKQLESYLNPILGDKFKIGDFDLTFDSRADQVKSLYGGQGILLGFGSGREIIDGLIPDPGYGRAEVDGL